MLQIGKYANVLRRKYQNRFLNSIERQITSHVTYDESNLFVYCPIPPQMAWTCKSLLKEEKFRIRGNIFYNNQAGKQPEFDYSERKACAAHGHRYEDSTA